MNSKLKQPWFKWLHTLGFLEQTKIVHHNVTKETKQHQTKTQVKIFCTYGLAHFHPEYHVNSTLKQPWFEWWNTLGFLEQTKIVHNCVSKETKQQQMKTQVIILGMNGLAH